MREIWESQDILNCTKIMTRDIVQIFASNGSSTSVLELLKLLHKVQTLISLNRSWLEVYANLQSPKTPKNISDKVQYRFVTTSKKKTGFIRRADRYPFSCTVSSVIFALVSRALLDSTLASRLLSSLGGLNLLICPSFDGLGSSSGSC
ncbi:hypothetical protein TNCV_409661 [Trichonephila clavipes]|nr:hypothetical protein TNCV_409661 [Trichonephila clavipes]